MIDLTGRNFLKELDFSREEFLSLVDLAAELRDEKRHASETRRLKGKNIALIFEKPSTRTRSAFEVAAHDQGAHVSYIGPDESQLGVKESMKDTARVLGRMFEGIEYRGYSQSGIELLGEFAGVPVWNGLTDEWHPTQMLADLLTLRDHSAGSIEPVKLCYMGDARNNTARSLLVTGALVGLDVRLAAPRSLWPPKDVRSTAEHLASGSGARVLLTDEPEAALQGSDFVYTDVWLSMGEPATEWGDRIDLLLPYQVNGAAMKATGNPAVKFLHCLPALHDRQTQIGQKIYDQYGLDSLEVTDEVFESPSSLVFDQAENRLHTIKAVMVATLGD
jgi:ornithine carbamoyltransferase